jgi:hypothetical protein
VGLVTARTGEGPVPAASAVVTDLLLHAAQFLAALRRARCSRDDVSLADVTLLSVTDAVTVVTTIRS